jgi:hypothetical protein
MSASLKVPYADLFPAAIDPTIVSWVLMVGLPLAMLFLLVDKWQWKHATVPIRVEHHQASPAHLPRQ